MPAQVKCPAHSFTATQARGPSAQSPTLRGNLASHFCLNSSLGGSIPQVTAAAHPQGKHHFSQPGQHLLPTAPFLAHPWQTIHPSEVPSVTAPEKPSIRGEQIRKKGKAGQGRSSRDVKDKTEKSRNAAVCISCPKRVISRASPVAQLWGQITQAHTMPGTTRHNCAFHRGGGCLALYSKQPEAF